MKANDNDNNNNKQVSVDDDDDDDDDGCSHEKVGGSRQLLVWAYLPPN